MANVRMTKTNIIVIFFLFSVPTACVCNIHMSKYTGVGCRGDKYHCELRVTEWGPKKFWGGTYATEEEAARACDVIVYYIHREHRYNFPDSLSYIEKFCESRDQAPLELEDLRKFIRSQARRLVDAIAKETAEDDRRDGMAERVGDGRPNPPDIGSSHHAPRPSLRQEGNYSLDQAPEPSFSQEEFSLLHLPPEPSFSQDGNDSLHHAPEPSFSQDEVEFLYDVFRLRAVPDALLPNCPQLFNGEDQLQTAPCLEGVERWVEWLLSRSDSVESIMVEMEKVIAHFTALSDVTCGEDVSPPK